MQLGELVGCLDGIREGRLDGRQVGLRDGLSVGIPEGLFVGFIVGVSDGTGGVGTDNPGSIDVPGATAGNEDGGANVVLLN